jgi:hypothetical protein
VISSDLKPADIVPAIGIDRFKSSRYRIVCRYRIVNIGISAIPSTALYARWVDQVGDGVSPYETSVPLRHLHHLDDLDAAADFLFLQDSVPTSVAAVQRSFLSPFNARVDLFNRLMLERIPGRAGIPIFPHDLSV